MTLESGSEGNMNVKNSSEVLQRDKKWGCSPCVLVLCIFIIITNSISRIGFERYIFDLFISCKNLMSYAEQDWEDKLRDLGKLWWY